MFNETHSVFDDDWTSSAQHRVMNVYDRTQRNTRADKLHPTELRELAKFTDVLHFYGLRPNGKHWHMFSHHMNQSTGHDFSVVLPEHVVMLRGEVALTQG